jgi:hypothetical protein
VPGDVLDGALIFTHAFQGFAAVFQGLGIGSGGFGNGDLGFHQGFLGDILDGAIVGAIPQFF